MKCKIFALILSCIFTFNVMAQQKIVQTAGRDALGDFAPEFAHLAFSVPGDKTENVWLEPVSDEEYNKLK